jgi:hypothetical protein
MSVLRIRSKRTELKRYRVSSRASGRLVSMDGDRLINVRPTDVSKRGLGFISREFLQQGGQFWLEVDEARVRVEITHCQSHLGIDSMFQCGVFTRDPDIDLESIFARLGFLEDVLQADGF